MFSLPDDIIINILTYMNICGNDILNIRLSNKHIYNICNQTLFISNYPLLNNESFYQLVYGYFLYKKNNNNYWHNVGLIYDDFELDYYINLEDNM